MWVRPIRVSQKGDRMAERKWAICPKHGMVHKKKRSRGRGWRCPKCKYTMRMIRKIRRKRMLVDMLGGACQKCGYNFYLGALEFHHRDPATKKMDFSSSNLTLAWDTLVEEITKCDLLCANCHREEHFLTDLIV